MPGEAARRSDEQAKPPEDGREEQVPESGPRSSRRGDFGISATETLSKLETEVEKLREAGTETPEQRKDLAIAEKKLELFLNEHDNAGAFKFKKFGREVVGFMEERPDRPKVIETDKETGKLTLGETERNRRVMFINMGELDRINKEGGSHAAGDAALTETVKTIERAVQAKLAGKTGKEAGYSMLRYRGNEFMVSFDDISQEDFKDIMSSIEAQKPSVEGVEEGAPLVAQGFDFKEAIDIVNDLQARLPEEVRLDLSDPATAAREIIGVMNKRADYSLDVKKFRSRVERVQEKIRTDGPEKAQVFFDNYMKKMFQNTDLADLGKFEGLSKEDVDRRAYEHAGKFLGAAADEEKARSAIVEARLKEIEAKKPEKEPSFMESIHLQGPPLGAKLARVPQRTRGQSVIDRHDESVRAAEVLLRDERDIELAKLEKQIETARRDGGTGLLERGVHYENLEQAFKEGKEVQMVFVDMGFLRYFDNKGGADVGNDALKVAADLMEEAIEKSGVEGKAFRYGGDEFTVQIEGGDTEVAKFQRALAELRDAAGAIPTGKRGTADGYHPTELVFNYGGADMGTTEAVFEDLKTAGKFADADLEDPDWVANKKAEIMTMIADKSIEEQKAIGRFQMLIEAKNDPAYETEPARKVQVDNLVAFSNKALFAELGGGRELERLADMQKAEMAAANAIADEGERAKAVEAVKEATKERIEAFVADCIDKTRRQEDRKADLLTELIELHGKIADLEDSLAEARQETEEEKQEISRLAAELTKAREERQQLLDIRKTLSSE